MNFEKKTENTNFLGARLKELRSEKNMSLESVAQETRISLHHLVALENGTSSQLPDLVFVRGFLRNLARLFDVSPDEFLKFFPKEKENEIILKNFAESARKNKTARKLKAPINWAEVAMPIKMWAARLKKPFIYVSLSGVGAFVVIVGLERLVDYSKRKFEEAPVVKQEPAPTVEKVAVQPEAVPVVSKQILEMNVLAPVGLAVTYKDGRRDNQTLSVGTQKLEMNESEIMVFTPDASKIDFKWNNKTLGTMEQKNRPRRFVFSNENYQP